MVQLQQAAACTCRQPTTYSDGPPIGCRGSLFFHSTGTFFSSAPILARPPPYPTPCYPPSPNGPWGLLSLVSALTDPPHGSCMGACCCWPMPPVLCLEYVLDRSLPHQKTPIPCGWSRCQGQQLACIQLQQEHQQTRVPLGLGASCWVGKLKGQ